MKLPSNDGTEIAVFRSEEGPPLVLVHGTTGLSFATAGLG
jgi:hypothetical protein